MRLHEEFWLSVSTIRSIAPSRTFGFSHVSAWRRILPISWPGLMKSLWGKVLGNPNNAGFEVATLTNRSTPFFGDIDERKPWCRTLHEIFSAHTKTTVGGRAVTRHGQQVGLFRDSKNLTQRSDNGPEFVAKATFPAGLANQQLGCKPVMRVLPAVGQEGPELAVSCANSSNG
jgi:hypothetical protein